ncbi:hypothetical protein CEXT_610871 [Caerostris extrusa]|uniref:Uncharacterized protein n=1 Tax=Caerostris extrusa TaxID=172846 RepID=A0AAV4NPS1_CAEEX|nr:hypothetical protein CEXT_610871 [Caerostris extrusa]
MPLLMGEVRRWRKEGRLVDKEWNIHPPLLKNEGWVKEGWDRIGKRGYLAAGFSSKRSLTCGGFDQKSARDLAVGNCSSVCPSYEDARTATWTSQVSPPYLLRQRRLAKNIILYKAHYHLVSACSHTTVPLSALSFHPLPIRDSDI